MALRPLEWSLSENDGLPSEEAQTPVGVFKLTENIGKFAVTLPTIIRDGTPDGVLERSELVRNNGDLAKRAAEERLAMHVRRALFGSPPSFRQDPANLLYGAEIAATDLGTWLIGYVEDDGHKVGFILQGDTYSAELARHFHGSISMRELREEATSLALRLARSCVVDISSLFESMIDESGHPRITWIRDELTGHPIATTHLGIFRVVPVDPEEPIWTGSLPSIVADNLGSLRVAHAPDADSMCDVVENLFLQVATYFIQKHKENK